mmetsp:Transcript_24748/g.68934  ORF Transcript_24748/g.68934 Transcript_24748/m.68934 type:complete len:382 (-) Transcript_24748:233-1378(-)
MQPFLQHNHAVYTNTALMPSLNAASALDIQNPTLLGRTTSVVMHYLMSAIFGAIDHLYMDRKYAKAGLQASGGCYAAYRKVSPVLMANEPLMNVPVLLPPHVKAIGSITPHEPHTALPSDLQAFLDSARDDSPAIFMSFGTSGVGNVTAEVFTQVWGALPNVKVVWRVPGKLTDPAFEKVQSFPNVRLESWVDQNAVLAHPRVQLFITHGGHNGVSEGAFHGVPLLCMPQFADQFDMCALAERRGYAVSVAGKEQQTQADFIQEAVSKLLADVSTREMATKISAGMKLFRKHRMPTETAAELIELEIEAIRQGAARLELPPAITLMWELQQVLVYAMLLATVAACGWLSWATLSACCRCLCCRRRAKQQPSKGATGKAKAS